VELLDVSFVFVFCCGPLRLGSVVRTSLQNLASAAGMCLLGFRNSSCVHVGFDVLRECAEELICLCRTAVQHFITSH
jgi:hypothetical protein